MRQFRRAAERGPTSAELAAIEREWPLIEAELGVLDAELALLQVERRLSALDWRRLRRAEQRVLREALALARPDHLAVRSLNECLADAPVAEPAAREVA